MRLSCPHHLRTQAWQVVATLAPQAAHLSRRSRSSRFAATTLLDALLPPPCCRIVAA